MMPMTIAAIRFPIMGSPAVQAWSSRGRPTPEAAFRTHTCLSGLTLPGSALTRVRRAQMVDRPADEPGDVHLRDAHALADLRLGEVLAEAQVQHQPLTLAQAREHVIERDRVLDPAEGVVGAAERVAERPALAVVLAARPVERDAVMRPRRHARLQHLLHGGLHARGDLRRGGDAAELA